MVKDVYVEENDGTILLTLENQDQTKKSAILKDANDGIDTEPNIINTIKKMLEVWGQRRIKIAEQYARDRRNEDAFLYDVVTLAKHISMLPQSEILLDISEGTILMHNRIVSQILNEYHALGYEINPKPTNFLNNKRHDFNISNFRCEVKTIQTLGKLEHLPLGGMRFTDSCKESLISSIRDDLEDAQAQVGNGVIILAPWSYKVNAILRKYFEKQLSTLLPPLVSNLTILVLTSRRAFEDYYIPLGTDKVLSFFESAFAIIQSLGLRDINYYFIREGLTFRATTAPVAGSSVGMVFEMD